MPFCGYSPKMVEGLMTFSEGLLEATEERAAENGISLLDAFDIELAEIRAMIDAMNHASGRQPLVRGLGLFAEELFSRVVDRARSDARPFKECFHEELASVSVFVKELEDTYQDYRTNLPVPQAMSKLASFAAMR